jgi:two-component system phosphate regulon sensor histidine kinase PhoR
VFLLDDEGVVRLWNRAAETVTGLSEQEACGQKLTELIREWEALEQAIPISDAGVSARSATVPVEVRERDLWLSFVAVRSAGGVVYAFRDVTVERRLEEERSDFVATISHELRTPMAAVYGAAETLLRRNIELASEQGRQLLEMIARQAARLGQITEDVLLTRNLDRGDVRLEREPVDVAELVRATVAALESQQPAPVSVDVEIEEGAALVSGDSDRIQQVLVNLLDNAFKYGASSPIAVRVQNANGSVRVSVGDSGPGILPADRERIFEKFFRGDPQLMYAPSGTGLGLYISRELAQRMGGSLDVSSAPGAGATFVLELPRA